MKNTLLLLMIICATNKVSAQSCDFLIPRIEHLCQKSKKRLYVIPGQGILHHIRCPKNMGGNIFVLSNNTESLYGCLLNKSYDLGNKKMRVKSTGTKFFTVKTAGVKYKYDFLLRSWTVLKKLETGLSTGNREDP